MVNPSLVELEAGSGHLEVLGAPSLHYNAGFVLGYECSYLVSFLYERFHVSGLCKYTWDYSFTEGVGFSKEVG